MVEIAINLIWRSPLYGHGIARIEHPIVIVLCHERWRGVRWRVGRYGPIGLLGGKRRGKEFGVIAYKLLEVVHIFLVTRIQHDLMVHTRVDAPLAVVQLLRGVEQRGHTVDLLM